MKIVLFDLDGTLVSTGGAGIRALDLAFEKVYGLRGAMTDVHPSGKTDPKIIREIVNKKLGRPAQNDEVAEICEAYLGFLPQEVWLAGNYRTLPGVEDCLKALQSEGDVLLGLGTGNLERGARIKLDPAGLNSYFTFGGFGSDSEDRAQLLKIGASRAPVKGQGVSPHNVLVVGDTVLDILAAREAGFPVAAVYCGHGDPDELKAANPDLLVKDFTDPDIFLRFFESSQYRSDAAI